MKELAIMEYKKIKGTVEYDEETGDLYGKILNLSNDCILYEGFNMMKLRENFEKAVDDYIELKKEAYKKSNFLSLIRAHVYGLTPLDIEGTVKKILEEKNWIVISKEKAWEELNKMLGFEKVCDEFTEVAFSKEEFFDALKRSSV